MAAHKKYTTEDLMNGVPITGRRVWIDHVHYDVPNTLEGAVCNAPNCVKAITFRSPVLDQEMYAGVRKICAQRDIAMVRADPPEYVRIWPNAPTPAAPR